MNDVWPRSRELHIPSVSVTVTFIYSFSLLNQQISIWGALWPSGRASDSRARGRRFDTYLCRVVSLSKDTFTHRKVLVIPRKRWLRPDMPEKLFPGTLSRNKTKTNFQVTALAALISKGSIKITYTIWGEKNCPVVS